MSLPVAVTEEKSTIAPHQKFKVHDDNSWVCGAIHLPGGHRIMTFSVDGSLSVWNMKSGKQIGDDWWDEDSQVCTIALSPDGKKMVSGDRDGGVGLWNIDTGKVITKWLGHTECVASVCWTQDGQRVLSGSCDGTARQWDVENGETILEPIKTGHDYVSAVAYSPDTTKFATGGCFKQHHMLTEDNDSNLVCPIKIWDTRTGKLVATLNGHNWTSCLAWTPDGLFSGDRLIRRWNTTSWKQIALLKDDTGSIFEIAISPNSRILASVSGSTARLWNLDNNQSISLVYHQHGVNSVSFSADGKLLITSSADDNVYTWDISAIVKEAGLDELLLDQHDKSVTADATRRPVRQPIKVSSRVPQGFFDDIPHRVHSSVRLNPHNVPSQSRIFHWVRDLLSAGPNSAETEHHSAVVNVPHCQAKRRNASAREQRRPIPLKYKKPASRLLNSNTTQSSNAAQAQSSPQPQTAISTSSSTPPLVADTTPSTNPHIVIRHAGRWTRFWVSICCTSSEYTDDHH